MPRRQIVTDDVIPAEILDNNTGTRLCENNNHMIGKPIDRRPKMYNVRITPVTNGYSVLSIKRTGSLNNFEVFYHPEHFFHALNEIFLPP